MFHLWPWKCNGKYKQTGVREPFPSARLIPKAIVCLCFVSGSWPLSLLYLCSQVPAWWSKEETHVQNSCKLAYNFSARTVRENCTCQLLVFFWRSWALKILKLHILLSFPTQRFGCQLSSKEKRWLGDRVRMSHLLLQCSSVCCILCISFCFQREADISAQRWSCLLSLRTLQCYTCCIFTKVKCCYKLSQGTQV